MWLNDQALERLLSMVDAKGAEEAGRLEGNRVLSAALKVVLGVLRVDILIAAKRYDDALTACEEGLGIQSIALKNPRTKREGIVPLLVYLKAYTLHLKKDVLGSKHALEKMSSYGKHELEKAIKFKCTQLKRSIGADLKGGYTKLQVAARRDEKIQFRVEASDMCQTVGWEFAVEAHSIGYRIEFDGEVLAESERVESSAGVVSGEHAVDRDGILTVTFTNAFSWMRAKTVQYRITPDFLEAME